MNTSEKPQKTCKCIENLCSQISGESTSSSERILKYCRGTCHSVHFMSCPQMSSWLSSPGKCQQCTFLEGQANELKALKLKLAEKKLYVQFLKEENKQQRQVLKQFDQAISNLSINNRSMMQKLFTETLDIERVYQLGRGELEAEGYISSDSE